MQNIYITLSSNFNTTFYIKNPKLKMFFSSILLFLCFNEILSADDVGKQKRILLNDNYYTIISKLEALEKDMAAVKAIQANKSHQTVAFMAYLTKTITGKNHHIYFDDVKLNLGNAYNPHHGTFVAPVNGTYQFTVTACSEGGHYVVLEINVNNSNLGKVIAGDTSYSECSSKTFIAQLQNGDDVFIQQGVEGDYLLAYSPEGYPSFTGFLLQAN